MSWHEEPLDDPIAPRGARLVVHRNPDTCTTTAYVAANGRRVEIAVLDDLDAVRAFGPRVMEIDWRALFAAHPELWHDQLPSFVARVGAAPRSALSRRTGKSDLLLALEEGDRADARKARR